MKRALLLALLAAAPACAQETTPATVTPPAPTIPAPPVVVEVPVPTAIAPSTTAPSFLSSRGIVSSQELVDTLNAKLTPQQRAQLDQAIAKRNAALTKANDELSATLRDLLRETDEGLTRRIDDEAEAKRMERMRRLQPGRYQHLMQQKKKQEEKAAKENQKPQ